MSCIKLSPEKVRNIRKLLSTGVYTHAQLAKRYNVSRGHITKISNQKRWNEIQYPQI
jgi:hypothetical protein